MDKKKDLTKELLADCFRDLMLTVSFDKITIKMITDRAGLIRPTFYKHFQDKYEVLEWIFQTDVADSVNLLIDNGMEFDAVLMFCRCLEKNKKFYRKAYQMEPGPNSFDNILSRYVYSSFLRSAANRNISLEKKVPGISTEQIAAYYSYGLVCGIRDWIVLDSPLTAEELASAYRFLMTHSIFDVISV